MLFAKCVRPCEFRYGGCENVGKKIHPRYAKVEDLLKDEQGNFYCHKGELLTIYDSVCEDCGEELEPSRDEREGNILAFRCPSCNKLVRMEV